jgi:hypothetical protein
VRVCACVYVFVCLSVFKCRCVYVRVRVVRVCCIYIYVCEREVEREIDPGTKSIVIARGRAREIHFV